MFEVCMLEKRYYTKQFATEIREEAEDMATEDWCNGEGDWEDNENPDVEIFSVETV
jgi:hypothetical protein